MNLPSVTIYEREAKIASASLASQKVARRLHDGLISAAQLCRSWSLQEMRVNRFSRSQSSRGNFCSDTWRISFAVVRYLSLVLERNLRRHVLRKFHPFKVGPIITGGVVAVAVVFSRLIAFLSPPILVVSETPSFPIGHQYLAAKTADSTFLSPPPTRRITIH